MTLLNQSKNPQHFVIVGQSDKTIAMSLWLISLFTLFLGPLIIWLLKRGSSPFVNAQGKNYFNYAVSYTLYSLACIAMIILFLLLTIHSDTSPDTFFTLYIALGLIPLIILSLISFTYTIIGTIMTSNGKDFAVPLSIRFFK